jgi:hypothetical protein
LVVTSDPTAKRGTDSSPGVPEALGLADSLGGWLDRLGVGVGLAIGDGLGVGVAIAGMNPHPAISRQVVRMLAARRIGVWISPVRFVARRSIAPASVHRSFMRPS